MLAGEGSQETHAGRVLTDRKQRGGLAPGLHRSWAPGQGHGRRQASRPALGDPGQASLVASNSSPSEMDRGSQGPPQALGLGDEDISSGSSSPLTLPCRGGTAGPHRHLHPILGPGKAWCSRGPPDARGPWRRCTTATWSMALAFGRPGFRSHPGTSYPSRPHSGPRVHDTRDRPDAQASGLPGRRRCGGAGTLLEMQPVLRSHWAPGNSSSTHSGLP